MGCNCGIVGRSTAEILWGKTYKWGPNPCIRMSSRGHPSGTKYPILVSRSVGTSALASAVKPSGRYSACCSAMNVRYRSTPAFGALDWVIPLKYLPNTIGKIGPKRCIQAKPRFALSHFGPILDPFGGSIWDPFRDPKQGNYPPNCIF